MFIINIFKSDKQTKLTTSITGLQNTCTVMVNKDENIH